MDDDVDIDIVSDDQEASKVLNDSVTTGQVTTAATFELDSAIQSINESNLDLDYPELDGDENENEDAEGESEMTGSDYSDMDDDVGGDIAETIGQQLDDALWADITQAYSNSVPLTSQAPTPEQNIIHSIQRILTYLATDPDIESVFSSHSVQVGNEGRDALSTLRSLSNTNVVDSETATALSEALLKIADSEHLQDDGDGSDTESDHVGSKRKRSVSDTGVKIEEE